MLSKEYNSLLLLNHLYFPPINKQIRSRNSKNASLLVNDMKQGNSPSKVSVVV